MREIVQAAKMSAGVELDHDVVEKTIEMDPLTSYLKPSMQQDLEKVSFQSSCLVGLPPWRFVLLSLCADGIQTPSSNHYRVDIWAVLMTYQGNFIEFENLLGEPLREGKKAGVQMPTLEVLYRLAKAIQWRNMEKKGLVEVPKKT
jgi:hypothetical protein